MYKFNMDAFLFDYEMSMADLAGKIKKSRATIKKIRERGTVKPSFIQLLKSYKFKPDPYTEGKQ